MIFQRLLLLSSDVADKITPGLGKLMRQCVLQFSKGVREFFLPFKWKRSAMQNLLLLLQDDDKNNY